MDGHACRTRLAETGRSAVKRASHRNTTQARASKNLDHPTRGMQFDSARLLRIGIEKSGFDSRRSAKHGSHVGMASMTDRKDGQSENYGFTLVINTPPLVYDSGSKPLEVVGERTLKYKEYGK